MLLYCRMCLLWVATYYERATWMVLRPGDVHEDGWDNLVQAIGR